MNLLTVEIKIAGQRGTRLFVMSVAEARAACSEAIDAAGIGASAWLGGVIMLDGKKVARLSYNGRLWSAGSSVSKTGVEVELNDDFTVKRQTKEG